ncbi:histidine kinase [Desulfitibacter alkalitolerans]|uniref:histidine kinase n=1 Tax=Desulfitibacter alkalitolerans TaxID=264641 RepID=UPI00047F1E51|nr:histidine kinase [Desulfitibacter alkalitolerans]
MNQAIRNKINQIFDLEILDEQHYEWGDLYWLQLDSNGLKTQPTLSFATVFPGKEQEIHTHAGYVEILHGIEGESIHIINGKELVLTKGKLGYVPDGAQHYLINKSDKPSQFLSIVYPALPAPLNEMETIDGLELYDIDQLVNLNTIADKFAQSVKLAVTLVDSNGVFLAEPKSFPDFCSLCIKQKTGNCVLCTEKGEKKGKELVVFKCKFKVYSIQSPIIINNRLLGYLGCGYGRVETPADADELLLKNSFSGRDYPLAHKAYVNLGIINRNHLKSVAETLSLVGASLVQMIIDSARSKQISAYKLSLVKEEQRKAELESSLNEARLKFLESQVNPHFLFNTLNTIAQTSFMEGAATASNLTYALSNLLRRSLGKTQSLISIEEEIEQINDYLLIQKTRFPRKFTVRMDIKEEVLSTKVPNMTLMVLVENAILHGFSNIRWHGMLEINGYMRNNRVVIDVIDNGAGVKDEVINEVRELTGNSFNPISPMKGIGLKNIYKRLEYYYGEKFSFCLERLNKGGTKATIELPAETAIENT